MHTEVILTKNVQDLGAEGDKVVVAPGYARNYLIPRGFAKRATEASLRHIEILKKKRAERETAEKTASEEFATQISKLACSITVKTGQHDKMFGSVTAGDLHEWLDKHGVKIERKQIVLERPIHQVGEHHVTINLLHGVTAHLKVEIVAEAPAPSAAPAVTDRRGPRRGDRPERIPARGAERKAEPKSAGKPAARTK
jgi:large subunit ribosomal protein L9